MGTVVIGMVDKKRLIEAALFMSSDPVPVDRLNKLIGVAAPGYTKTLIKEINEEYLRNGNAFEIIEEPDGYLMTLRPEYAVHVKEFAKETELSPHALKTLAYISKNEGILKSELVKRLGTQVYKDVKELVGKGFIVQKKKGRSSELRTSEKFRKYFGV